MSEETEKNNGGSVCGCGDGQCCGSSWKSTLLVMLVLIAGVIVARNIGKRGNTSCVENDAGAPVVADVEIPEGLPVLLELGSRSCVPCKKMMPILEDLKEAYGGQLGVISVDIKDNQDAGRKYGIRVIPTQIFLDAEGRELFRHEGFFGKEDILAKWKELGVDISGVSD